MAFSARLAVGCIVLGLVLLAASVIWPRLIKDDQIWSRKQAHEHSQAASSLHHMTHAAAEAQMNDRISDAKKARWSAQLKAAQDRYDTSRDKLDQAKRVRGTAAVVMRCLAIALLIIGAVRYVVLQSDSGRR